MYDLYSEFDIQKHQETFKDYLEIIILPTGRIEYAVPSHQEKLIAIAMEKYHCSREKILTMCPPDMYSDFLTWLQHITGCIAVWTEFHTGKPNRFQRIALQKLQKAGLFTPTKNEQML